MEHFLHWFIILPLCGFLLSLLLSSRNERGLALLSICTASVQLIALAGFSILWLLQGSNSLDIKHLTLFATADIEIFIDFYFDVITATYALVGALAMLTVSIFSKYYLHREEGYKRFFSTLLFFFGGYNIVVFSGNFETLFVGWEMVGITSFLLIAFYRDRYLPVKNSLKVIFVYRIGDICLILAMWMSHHLWHQNITFLKLNDAQAIAAHIGEHYWYAVFIATMLVIGAMVKSAQFPFSSWLPRAMEGPTSSSAIFYGSLSVHLGVFVLLRSFPYWETLLPIRWLLAIAGLSTAFIAGTISSVQSSVKTRIAYASAAQIGIIFIEIAIGLHQIALLHFAGNAFLRMYQLLVSPSVMGYKVHNMMFHPQSAGNRSLKLKWYQPATLYMLSLREWYQDVLQFNLLWVPFKRIGRFFNGMNRIAFVMIITGLLTVGVVSFFFSVALPTVVADYLPFFFSTIALLLILQAFSENGDARYAWFNIVLSQLVIALSIALLNENFGHNHILLYLSGSVLSAITGFGCLFYMQRLDDDIQLSRYHGYVYHHPWVSIMFLLSCLGLVGLPFTPTFIGIDLLFSHIHKHETFMIVIVSLCFLFVEIAVLRIYARVFLGPYKRPFHPVAYRSS